MRLLLCSCCARYLLVLGTELKGKIRVYVRWRPMGTKEIADEERAVLQRPDDYTVRHPGRDEGKPYKEYHMDYVFDETSTQGEVFAGTKVSCRSLPTDPGQHALHRLRGSMQSAAPSTPCLCLR